MVSALCLFVATALLAGPAASPAPAARSVRLPAVDLPDGARTLHYESRRVVALLHTFSGPPVPSPKGEPPFPEQPVVLVLDDGRVLWRAEGSSGAWRTGTVPAAKVTVLLHSAETLDEALRGLAKDAGGARDAAPRFTWEWTKL